VSDEPLAALVLAYAVVLAGGSWIAERLPVSSGRRGGRGSPWAREEAVGFRRGMARVVRGVAAFLLFAVLVRSWGTAWAWAALLLLATVAGVDARSSGLDGLLRRGREIAPGRTREGKRERPARRAGGEGSSPT